MKSYILYILSASKIIVKIVLLNFASEVSLHMSILLISAKCKNKNSLVVLSTSNAFVVFKIIFLHPNPPHPTSLHPLNIKRSGFWIALVYNHLLSYSFYELRNPNTINIYSLSYEMFKKTSVYNHNSCNCVKRDHQSYSTALQKVMNAAHCTELVRMNMLGAYEATLVICPYLLEIASPLPSRRFLSRWWILKAICSQLRTRADIHTCVSEYSYVELFV